MAIYSEFSNEKWWFSIVCNSLPEGKICSNWKKNARNLVKYGWNIWLYIIFYNTWHTLLIHKPWKIAWTCRNNHFAHENLAIWWISIHDLGIWDLKERIELVSSNFCLKSTHWLGYFTKTCFFSKLRLDTQYEYGATTKAGTIVCRVPVLSSDTSDTWLI